MRRWPAVKRWLAAPMQLPDGTLVECFKGTPQGSAVSPVLANLFMHFAFDTWMARKFPGCPFERYAGDSVVHCVSKVQAEMVLAAIAERMNFVSEHGKPEERNPLQGWVRRRWLAGRWPCPPSCAHV
jgi:RNA-directed DNA polymerase